MQFYPSSRHISLLFFFLALLYFSLLHTTPSITASAVQAISNPNTWLAKLTEPDKIILSPDQIKAYNDDIYRNMPDVVCNLTTYPETFSKTALFNMIKKASIEDTSLYTNRARLTPAYYSILQAEMNLSAIVEHISPTYAITVCRSNIRTFPTADKAFSTPDDHKFDRFQETSVNINEPLIILHKSRSGNWCFVQTTNYRGWIATKSLALTRTRSEWISYITDPNFLIISAAKLKANYEPSPAEVFTAILYMGCKVNLNEQFPIPDSITGYYVAKLPDRDDNGYLVFKNVRIQASADISVGYLPYNAASIIKQAFKIHGAPYGWGGSFDSWDCSSLVADIYKCFGFNLPRNAAKQESMIGKTNSFASAIDRKKLFDKLKPGSILFLPGHAMLYLGKENDKHYIIHALAAYSSPAATSPDRTPHLINVDKVVVTDLGLYRANGKTFLESITISKSLE